MKRFYRSLKNCYGVRFLSYFFVFLIPLFIQSCTEEKDIAASLDDFKQVHKGPSYPAPSYDDASFIYNVWVAWITDFNYPLKLNGNDAVDKKDQLDKLRLMAKFQFIQKGSQNKYTGGKLVTRLSYIELPLYALYERRLPSGARVFGGAGPYFAYGIGGKIKSTNNGQTTSVKSFSKEGGFKRFDIGLALVAGYKTPKNIGFSLGYELGLANVEISNPGGDKTMNRGFNLNVSYDLDKLIAKVKKK